MISIDRLEEMAIEELETKLNNWKEQVELQSNFIDSLLKATNNFEWLNKTILDDETSEIIEKIELDYAQLDQAKAELDQLKAELEVEKNWHKTADEISKANCEYTAKLKQTLTEIKELLLKTAMDSRERCVNAKSVILQKISEVEE